MDGENRIILNVGGIRLVLVQLDCMTVLRGAIKKRWLSCRLVTILSEFHERRMKFCGSVNIEACFSYGVVNLIFFVVNILVDVSLLLFDLRST